MKLSKPEYNENVTDVDGLEKLRIQQEAETERKLIMEQELTKREKIKQEHDVKQSSGYMYRICWTAVAAGLAVVAMTFGVCAETENYISLLRARVDLQKAPPPTCPPPPECPKVSCQAVPVK